MMPAMQIPYHAVALSIFTAPEAIILLTHPHAEIEIIDYKQSD